MIETTVIIPNLNGMNYLGDCLRSLYHCETPEAGKRREGEAETDHKLQPAFPIIVVDNGSTDGSVEFMEREFPEVRLIRFSENRGFCGAVNAGIAVAKTPYVILLNNDTTVGAGFVSYLTEAVSRNQNYFSVGAKMVSMKQPELIDDAGDYYCALGWAFARGKGKSASRYTKPCNVFAACAGAAIYRRDILERLGGFDEAHFAYLEDMDIGYRARLCGYRNRFEPKALVYHAGSASSGSRYNAFKVRLSSRNSVYLIGKNMPPLQIILNLPFLLCGFFIKYLFFTKKGFGRLYLEGLLNGWKLCRSKEGRKRRVKFQLSRLPAYVRIEGELLYNLFVRRIFC
ncbi:MAG: glycosyltransferase family 2 protein [Lachnospiraceae bacterium]|nr:glycosyltransferase family 2 protein [Lachnospiraceae bacterium]